MSDTPDVSIVVPVYNAELHLRACLDSVVRQTMPGIEVIVVDDGSTDSSPVLLREFRSAHPDRVKVFTTENRGANHARNEAMRRMTGKYVLFVDSDDFLEPDMCERLHAKATRGDDDLVLCGAYDHLGDHPTARGTRLVNQDFNLMDFGYELVSISPFPWAKLFRRDVLEGLEFPELTSFHGNDGQYADLVLVLQACCRATRIGVVDEPLYHYRRTTVRGFSRRTLDVVLAFDLLVAFMKKNGYFDALRDELEYLCTLHFLHRYARMFKRRGDVALKLEFIGKTQGFLDREFPGWRRDRYLRRSSRRARSLVRFYASAAGMTRLVRAREHMPDRAARLLHRRLDRINVFDELDRRR